MADQKLLDYIKQNIGNLGEEGVRKRLIENGWEQSQVNQAIADYRKSQVAPAPGKSSGLKLSMTMMLIIVAVIALVAVVGSAIIFLPAMIPSGPACGDGICEGGETYSSCSADCDEPASCGDGTCDSGESYSSCPSDCDEPPSQVTPIGVSVSPATANSNVGSTVVIDIMAGGSEDLFGFQFNMEYDDSVLSYQGVSVGPFLEQDGYSTNCLSPSTSTAGQINNYACTRLRKSPEITPVGVTGDGLLAKVTFSAISSGTSTITLTNVKLADSSAREVEPDVHNGQVIVSS